MASKKRKSCRTCSVEGVVREQGAAQEVQGAGQDVTPRFQSQLQITALVSSGGLSVDVAFNARCIE